MPYYINPYKQSINIFKDNVENRNYGEIGISSIVQANTRFGFETKGVELVNLMEESIESCNLDKETMKLKFKPFEIHTLKIRI